MKTLFSVMTILMFVCLPAFAQTQHDRIRARGASTFDQFSNTQSLPMTGTTPSIAGGNVFRTANGGSTTVTNFLGGVDAQWIVVLCGDTNTIIQNNANISITGGANFSCVLNTGIEFVFNTASGVWAQVGGNGSGGGGGSAPGAPANSLQKNNGSGGFSASSITDNGTSVTMSEPFSGAVQHNGTETFAVPIVVSQATGTPPFTISSTTAVPNLNAGLLNGNTFQIPGTIGGTTPGAATFTTITANTSLAINGGTALTTTNRSGTGNLCMVTNCSMTTPTLSNPTVTTGTFSSPALTTPTIGGETITSSPRVPFDAVFPGALTATWTGQSFTLDKAITVTRLQAQLRVGPTGCSPNAIIRLSDGSSGIVNLTVTSAANDSGTISQNYAAGATLTLSVQTAAGGCAVSPGDANAIAEYKMQ